MLLCDAVESGVIQVDRQVSDQVIGMSSEDREDRAGDETSERRRVKVKKKQPTSRRLHKLPGTEADKYR